MTGDGDSGNGADLRAENARLVESLAHQLAGGQQDTWRIRCQTAFALTLRQIARCAVRETRSAVCATGDIEVDLLNLRLQALLGLPLCDGADAHADAHAAVTGDACPGNGFHWRQWRYRMCGSWS